MTPTERKYIARGRHLARTDLLWLGRHILGMDKLVEHVHRPLANTLQGFTECQGVDIWDDSRNQYVYTPPDEDPVKCIPYSIPSDRRRMILAPRGWYKTSVNIIDHTVQILLNFPNATISLTHASGEVAEQMLGVIKEHFWHNDKMRYFFPEYCQSEKKKDFGTQSKFDMVNRTRISTAPSVSVAGVESIKTGNHYHWMKFTDIVDEKNSSSKEQCEKIIHAFGMARNLLISPSYWIDVEGTRYSYADLYGKIVDEWHAVEKDIRDAEEKKRPPKKRHGWKCFTMGCYAKAWEGVKDAEEFTPDELDLPYKLDALKRCISRFPEEFPYDKLEEIRNDPVTGEQLFASQQLNNPVETSTVTFRRDMIKWKDPDDIARIPVHMIKMSVDSAETVKKRSDFSTITTALVDRMNRHYIIDIQHGKWPADELIARIFRTYNKYQPHKVKIEETGFIRGLQPSIKRKCQLTGVWPNFIYRVPSTDISKKQKILGLQPMFEEGLIYFSSELEVHVKEMLEHEVTRFPKYGHDDILDTLIEMFLNEKVSGPLAENKTMAQLLEHARHTMLTRLEEYNQIFDIQPVSNSWSRLGE